MRSSAWALVLLLWAGQAEAQPFDAAPWHTLLSTYASNGAFRYAALRENRSHRELLDRLAAAVGRSDPSRASRDAQLAFYIDAYNILVVDAVIDRWPIRSVMRVPGFFDRVPHRIARRTMTLNQLETFVRTRFAEPRVHFALNCASAGCPALGRTPYSMERDLALALERQARVFVRRVTRVDRAARVVRTSQIFQWYAADFARGGGVRAFLVARVDPSVAPHVRDRSFPIAYVPYDWALR